MSAQKAKGRSAAAEDDVYDGLAESKGKSSFLFKGGKYHVECTKCVLTPDSPTDPGYMDKWDFELSIRQGPEQDDGRAPDGRKFHHFVQIMRPGHPSYDKWKQIGIDEFKAIMLAFAVETRGSKRPDQDDFVNGNVAEISMAPKTEVIKTGAKKGESIEKNDIKSWKPAA